MSDNFLNLRNVIVFLLVAVVLFIPVKELYSMLVGAGDAACRASVIANTNTENPSGERFFELQCKRVELSISQEDVEQEKAFQKIGDRLKQCWDNMGRGELEQFEQNFALGGSNPCLVCATIEFGEVRQGRLTGFEQYLRNRDVGEGASLWKYLYEDRLESGSPVISYENGEWKQPGFKTSEKYYMIYKVYQPSVAAEQIEKKIGDLPFVPGEKEPYISIIEGEDLENLRCDYFYN